VSAPPLGFFGPLESPLSIPLGTPLAAACVGIPSLQEFSPHLRQLGNLEKLCLMRLLLVHCDKMQMFKATKW